MIVFWLRSWLRNPLLTAQFSLTIAIGMGATTALASVMLALAYQPLPFRDPGRLVEVWERPESGAPVMPISGPDLKEFADATRGTFTSLGAFIIPQLWLLDPKGATPIRACGIQTNVFSDLGIRPVLGRGVLPDDGPVNDGGTPPTWISYRLWQTRYGGSPSVIGATIGLAQNAEGQYESRMRIVGVLPIGVNIPFPSAEFATDMWYIFPGDISARPRQAPLFFGLGRLRPGVTVEQAQAALTVVARRLGQQYSFDRGKLPVVETLEEIAQSPARKTTGLLALGLGLVFLVGCVNLAILMGAEGRRRRREISIRAVLGAGRSRLWREVAFEKCLLTLLSLGLGVAVAFELLRVLTQLVPAAGIGPPLLHPPPLNPVVLLAFAVFALAAALVWSALLVRAADGPRSSLALASSGGLGYAGFSDSGPRAGRWGLILLAAQAGTGICLLAAAALTARTYAKLSAANLGPDPRHTVLMSVDPRDNVLHLNDAQSAEFNREVETRLGRLPGTQAVALAMELPPPASPASFMRQGDSLGTERAATAPFSVSPGYFRTLGIPILYGRGFNEADSGSSLPVAVVSVEMAKQNWPSLEQAVGSWFAFAPKYETHYKIVGVAKDFTGYWSQEPTPTVYFAAAQSKDCCDAVVLRSTASAQAVAALAPQALAGMAIPATVSEISTMQARWQATLTRPLARMAGMILLALLGLGLSVQGVYAVAAATVSARTHELAVRSALGAPPGRLAWNVTSEIVLAVGAGSVCGVVAAFAFRRLLEQWLGPLASSQAVPIAAAVVLLVLAAAVGCYVPARAAARANPADILRQG